jgi:hypothetical protein
VNHVWQPSSISTKFSVLQGVTNAMVRIEPLPCGRYLWQFRKIVSYAKTADEAKEYVEAGAEFFETLRRNPYA